jgi:hypothetical protein
MYLSRDSLFVLILAIKSLCQRAYYIIFYPRNAVSLHFDIRVIVFTMIINVLLLLILY